MRVQHGSSTHPHQSSVNMCIIIIMYLVRLNCLGKERKYTKIVAKTTEQPR